jgi:nitroreductase
MTACLQAAIAAPSIHNSQPWRFRMSAPTTVEVRADRSRRLAEIDPSGRELMISIGAAVLNLRMAISARGRMPLVGLFPDRAEPDLVARVTAGPVRAPNATVAALADAIPLRRTNRRPMRPTPVPERVLRDICQAAQVEGATLTVMDDRGRDGVLSLIRSANFWQRENPRYVEELASWTGHRDDGAGIPPGAYGPWDALETLPMRDFGQADPGQPRRPATFETDATIAVLYSAGEGPRQWVVAGQALERAWLTATIHGVASTPMSSVVEVPQLRRLLADDDRVRTPQVVLRLGYGDLGVAVPRRRLIDVLDPPALIRERKK